MKTQSFLPALFLFGFSANVDGFTVHTGSTPAGHEIIIRDSVQQARRLYSEGNFPASSALFDYSSPVDFINLGCIGGCRPRVDNTNIWATVLGARWVALRGFQVAPGTFGQQANESSTVNVPLDHLRCWEVVANTHDSVQYDHFLRTRANDETGPTGWTKTVSKAKARFEALFEMAVKKARAGTKIPVTDGGDRLTRYRNVPEGFFLLGRAMHLLQDSFSEEHVARTGYSKTDHAILEVFSRVCTGEKTATPAPKHAFQDGLSLHYGWECAAIYDDNGLNRDIIWKDRPGGDLKPSAQLAVLATTELLEAFVKALPAGSDITAVSRAFSDRWFSTVSQSSNIQVYVAEPNPICRAIDPAFCGPKNEALVNARFDGCLTGNDAVDELEGVGNANPVNGVRRSKYDAAWRREIPLTADCVMVPKPVTGATSSSPENVFFEMKCPDSAIYSASFLNEIKKAFEYTVNNFSSQWCTDGAKYLVDTFSNPLQMFNLEYFKEVDNTLNLKFEDSLLSLGSKVVRSCGRSVLVGLVSNVCGALATFPDLIRAVYDTVRKQPTMCLAAGAIVGAGFSYSPLGPAGFIIAGGGGVAVCGLALWLGDKGGKLLTCLGKVFNKASETLAGDINAKKRFAIGLGNLLVPPICESIGGLIGDLAAGGFWGAAAAPASSWLSKLDPILAKIKPVFERYDKVSSLAGQVFRIGPERELLTQFVNNFFGAGSGLESLLRQTPECKSAVEEAPAPK